MLQKRPFNLLYKLDSQASLLDKIHKVLFPARVAMSIFMLIVLVVFLFRFTLDMRLNRLIKESNFQLEAIQNEVDPYIDLYFDNEKLINLFRKYSDSHNPESESFFYSQSKVLSELETLTSSSKNISVVAYSLSNVDNSMVVSINGESKSFLDIDALVTSIKSLEFVEDALIVSQSSVKGENPKFLISVRLKSKVSNDL